MKLQTSLKAGWYGVLVFSVSAASAVTIGVSPNYTSNTFGGMLTVNIADLTNGETVVLERRLDANWDGASDAKDPLTLRVVLTDGQVATIGGVTNLNVPGDLNPLGGEITVRLNLYAPYLDQAIGPAHYWRVSSPTGRFAPAQASCMFTNAPFAQSVQGVVRCSGTNVVGSMVVALNVLADVSIAGAVVGSWTGNYTLRLPPGTYALVAARPGYVTDMAAAPVITLGPGQTITTNLNLLPATRTISGRLLDAADTNVVLPGVLIQADSATGRFAPAWTETNGQFTLAVTEDAWQLEPAGEDLARHGYLYPESQRERVFLTTTGDVSGIVLTAVRANALIYGKATNQTNAPLAGLRLRVHGQSGGEWFETADTVADDQGNFSAAIVGGANSGDNWWNFMADPILNPGASNQVMSGFLFGVPVLAGQALRQDVHALFATNRITGQVRSVGGQPVPGIGVFGWASLGGTTWYGSGFMTDLDGSFSMNVAGSPWMVALACDDLMDMGFNCAPAKLVTLPPVNPVVNFTVFPWPQPGLSDPVRVGNQFQLELHGEPFVTYEIQASTNLTHWSTLSWVQPIMNGPAYANSTVTDSAPAGARRFYRAVRAAP